jgi:hypothetical protein
MKAALAAPTQARSRDPLSRQKPVRVI